jgi:hypothetical protein
LIADVLFGDFVERPRTAGHKPRSVLRKSILTTHHQPPAGCVAPLTLSFTPYKIFYQFKKWKPFILPGETRACNLVNIERSRPA